MKVGRGKVQSMCGLTQQHIKEPGVEVAGASGVLAHADGGAGCCASDGRGAGLQVGHKGLQQHLGPQGLDYNESQLLQDVPNTFCKLHSINI